MKSIWSTASSEIPHLPHQTDSCCSSCVLVEFPACYLVHPGGPLRSCRKCDFRCDLNLPLAITSCMEPNHFALNPAGSMDKLEIVKDDEHDEPKAEDPFGDESQAGVRYKTMAWW